MIKNINNSDFILYTIKPGDNLYSLSIQFGTTIQDLINNNIGLNPYNLQIGQQIYINQNSNTNILNYWISTNEVNLIKQMNLVWEQHIMWTRMLLISIAENLKDLNDTKSRLLENPKDIANIFEKYYGNKIANIIEHLLTDHLIIGNDLIVALKNKNQVLAKQLTDKWYKNADDMANSFSSINAFYPKEQIRKMLYEHLRLTTNEVESRLKGDYKADIKAYDMVQKEILKMSQFFVTGIVKQFLALLLHHI